MSTVPCFRSSRTGKRRWVVMSEEFHQGGDGGGLGQHQGDDPFQQVGFDALDIRFEFAAQLLDVAFQFGANERDLLDETKLGLAQFGADLLDVGLQFGADLLDVGRQFGADLFNVFLETQFGLAQLGADLFDLFLERSSDSRTWPCVARSGRCG